MSKERTHTVSVRLNEAEHAAWLAAAGQAGRGQLGAWARDVVNASLSASEGLEAEQRRRTQDRRDAAALRKVADRLDPDA